MGVTRQTITLTLDVTLAQIVLLALRDAEDEKLGDCRFDRFVPDLVERQAFMKAFHAYNGDPEIFEEEMADQEVSQFRYFNPNNALGMLWAQLYQAVEDAGLEVRAEQFEDLDDLS
jgi:hypothetical protein